MENKLIRKTRKLFQKNKKRIYQAVIAKKVKQSILFIVGCQRSGTSMLLNVFDKDLNTKCFGEFSKLSSNDTTGEIRLNSLELVKKEFSRVKAPLIVAKPLVESQNVLELLDYFDNSRAVWMFRNYKDVASSNIKHFGIDNGIKDLGPIVHNEPNNWRSEKASDYVRETISKYFSENMNPYDAAVLFWFARNSIFFDLQLDKDPRVMMCCYEDLVVDPEKYVRSIYQQVGQVYPATGITTEVHSNSRRKGRDIELSLEIEQVAQELQKKLEATYQAKVFNMDNPQIVRS
ncbi:MAG: hypothetical protein EHM33_09390 [Chloroflexi bacterium]|nr:MAG: hypothetical protein EHM33_09390 [Chloroflexota bacterium]